MKKKVFPHKFLVQLKSTAKICIYSLRDFPEFPACYSRNGASLGRILQSVITRIFSPDLNSRSLPRVDRSRRGKRTVIRGCLLLLDALLTLSPTPKNPPGCKVTHRFPYRLRRSSPSPFLSSARSVNSGDNLFAL